MGKLTIDGLVLQGRRIARESKELFVGLEAQVKNKNAEELTDANLGFPADDELVSKLPAAIRGTKRYVNNFMTLSVEQQLEKGKVYAWDGILNEWMLAPYDVVVKQVFGYAMSENALQFWGIADVPEAQAGAKIYLSASVAGQIVTSRTKKMLGYGLAKGKAFLNTLGGM